jgi:hypothetical protein
MKRSRSPGQSFLIVAVACLATGVEDAMCSSKVA